jgi:hypothetical protein
MGNLIQRKFEKQGDVELVRTCVGHLWEMS